MRWYWPFDTLPPFLIRSLILTIRCMSRGGVVTEDCYWMRDRRFELTATGQVEEVNLSAAEECAEGGGTGCSEKIRTYRWSMRTPTRTWTTVPQIHGGDPMRCSSSICWPFIHMHTATFDPIVCVRVFSLRDRQRDFDCDRRLYTLHWRRQVWYTGV